MPALSDAAVRHAKSLFGAFGNANPSQEDIGKAVEKLLAEADQHKADPTSSLAYPLRQAFGN